MRDFEICVVLVQTLYDSNIGAASRAMANMGASRLVLIDPQTEVTLKAQQAAATGQAALQNRKTYQSWDEFFRREPEGLRISFTAKDGRGRQVQDFQPTLEWLKSNHPSLQETEASPLPVYLIFGREDWGLSTADLELTHFSCSIPIYGDNTSLNLAQAVLLALFILRSTWGGQRAIFEGQQPPRNRDEATVFPEKALRTWIEEMGFDISNRKINAYSVLKRMLLHNVPNNKELQMLETVLQQAIRKLREYNQMRKQLGLPAVESKSDQSES